MGYIESNLYNVKESDWSSKFLESWIRKEDVACMNNRKLDAYDALTTSAFYYDLLKDRSGLVKNKFDKDTIKNVIFNDPATIVLWKDGTKTVVKCQKETGDVYNPELGLAMCIVKKCCNNKGNYNDVFNKWLPRTNK
jgi:hypothetical protein